jgi:4-aminobutyrate aminotransferase-like enzyme
MMAGLHALKHKYELIGDVRGIGLFVGIELVKTREGKEPATEEASFICKAMCEKRVLISTDGPYNCVLKLKPPLALQKTDVDYFLASLD